MIDVCTEPLHWGLKHTTSGAPTAEPLDLEEVKLFLRVDDEREDVAIEAMMSAARALVEGHTSRRCLTQTIEVAMDGFPARGAPILVPLAPVVSISSIKSYATDNTESTFSSANYRLDTHSVPPRILLDDDAAWPTDLRAESGVLITLVMGYGADGSYVTDVALLHAMRLLIGHWYQHREAVGTVGKEIEFAYTALVQSVRVPWY
jgi:uncharacterized phiE125 gp8 family phage protein